VEEDDTKENNNKDLLKIGGDILNGLLGLLQTKIAIFRSLLQNTELHDAIGGTLKTGVDVTRTLLDVGPKVVKTGVDVTKGIVRTKVGVVKTLLSVGPDVIDGTRSAGSLLSSVAKAAGETAPLIQDGIQEFQDQIPLITGFASAYAGANAEQVQKVASRFVGSFQCDQECGHLQDEDLKTQCEQQFCEQLNDDEYEDYYDDDE